MTSFKIDTWLSLARPIINLHVDYYRYLRDHNEWHYVLCTGLATSL